MKRNRSVVIFLIIIIVAELGFKVYIDSHKEDFFLDELYSYGLMNYKTAYLFESSIVCSAMLSKKQHNFENITNLGLDIGIAFQIRDDIINMKIINIF